MRYRIEREELGFENIHGKTFCWTITHPRDPTRVVYGTYGDRPAAERAVRWLEAGDLKHAMRLPW